MRREEDGIVNEPLCFFLGILCRVSRIGDGNRVWVEDEVKMSPPPPATKRRLYAYCIVDTDIVNISIAAYLHGRKNI